MTAPLGRDRTVTVIALRGSRWFDGERFSAGPATMLIDGGKIIGREDGYPDLGDPWQVVEYDDATIIPGLFDCHVHLVADSQFGALDRVPGLDDEQLDAVVAQSLRDQLAAGVTTVRDLGDRRYAVLGHRDRQRAAEIDPEPGIVAAGPPLTTPRGHCYFLGGEVDDEAAIRMSISEHAERGVDVIKVMASGGASTAGTDLTGTQFTTEQLQLIVDLAHAAGLPVTAHAHALVAIEQCVDVGVDGIEHCSGMTATGVELPDALVGRIAERGIAVSGLVPAPVDMDLSQAPPALQDFVRRTGLTPQRAFAFRTDLIRRLHRHGVPVVVGNDSGLGPFLKHGRLHLGLSLLSAAGLSNAEVLAAATSRAAEVCGLGTRKGRLTAGFEADLVVVDGDLAADLDAIQRVRTVIRAGRLVPLSGAAA